MKNFTKQDALRSLRPTSQEFYDLGMPTQAQIDAELTRINNFSKSEKKQLQIRLGKLEDVLELNDRVEALETNSAVYAVNMSFVSRTSAISGNFTAVITEQYDDLGLTVNNDEGTLSGFLQNAVYKLEYQVANSLTTARAIQTFYGISPNSDPHTWATYGRGVYVGCPLTLQDRANDHNSNHALGFFVPRSNDELLNWTYYADAIGQNNTLKVRTLLLITRLK